MVKKKLSRTLKFCLMLAVAMVSVGQLSAADRTNYEFQAQYDKVFDGTTDGPYGEDANFDIKVSRLSGDGRILVFYGLVTNPGTSELERWIVIMNFDGTEERWIPSPANPDDGEQIQVQDIAISHYGENIYFSSHYSQNRIYLIQDGVPREILNTADYWEDTDGHFALVPSNEILRTTYDGDYVYFLEGKVFGFNDVDIWRIDSGGLKDPELILDDKLVSTNGGSGRMVKDFDVSHIGHPLVFILHGYQDAGGYHGKNEIFTMTTDSLATIEQLTDDASEKKLIRLSDDHSTMVFANGPLGGQWVGMDFDGSNRNELATLGYNVAGPSITLNGDTIFYYDHKAEGGRIVASNGRGHYPLFPNSSISLAATYDPEISADSSRVSFRKDRYTLHAGKLNLPLAFSTAPVIENINLDPPYIDTNDAEGRVLLTSRITDPQDNADISRRSLDHILAGDFASYSSLPLWFSSPPRDDGTAPDEEAGDNIYTAISKSTGYDSQVSFFTLRVGAQDVDGNVAVADTILGMPDSSCSSDTDPVTISLVIESGEPMFCVGSLQVHIEDIVVSNLSHLGVVGQSIGLALGGTISVKQGSTLSLGVH